MSTPLFYSKITRLPEGHFSFPPPGKYPLSTAKSTPLQLPLQLECRIHKIRTQFHVQNLMLSYCKSNKFGNSRRKTVDFHKYVQCILR